MRMRRKKRSAKVKEAVASTTQNSLQQLPGQFGYTGSSAAAVAVGLVVYPYVYVYAKQIRETKRHMQMQCVEIRVCIVVNEAGQRKKESRIEHKVGLDYYACTALLTKENYLRSLVNAPAV